MPASSTPSPNTSPASGQIALASPSASGPSTIACSTCGIARAMSCAMSAATMPATMNGSAGPAYSRRRKSARTVPTRADEGSWWSWVADKPVPSGGASRRPRGTSHDVSDRADARDVAASGCGDTAEWAGCACGAGAEATRRCPRRGGPDGQRRRPRPGGRSCLSAWCPPASSSANPHGHRMSRDGQPFRLGGRERSHARSIFPLGCAEIRRRAGRSPAPSRSRAPGPTSRGDRRGSDILSGLDTATAGVARVAGHDLLAMGSRERVTHQRRTVASSGSRPRATSSRTARRRP